MTRVAPGVHLLTIDEARLELRRMELQAEADRLAARFASRYPSNRPLDASTNHH